MLLVIYKSDLGSEFCMAFYISPSCMLDGLGKVGSDLQGHGSVFTWGFTMVILSNLLRHCWGNCGNFHIKEIFK